MRTYGNRARYGKRVETYHPPPVRVSSVGLWTYGAVRSLRLVGPDTIATRDLADHRGQRRALKSTRYARCTRCAERAGLRAGGGATRITARITPGRVGPL